MENIVAFIVFSSIAASIALALLVGVHILGGDGGGKKKASKMIGGRAPRSPRWAWPMLGHLHLLGKCLDRGFVEKQKKELGGVYALRFGRVRNVFVVDADIIQEGLVRKGAMFSKHLQAPSLGPLHTNFRDISSSNDDYWRFVRRNLLQNTLSSATQRSFCAMRRHYFHHLLPLLFLRHPQNLVPVYETCRLVLFSMVASFCFGIPLHPDHEHDYHLLETLRASLETGASFYLPLHIIDLFPFLRPIFFRNIFQRLSSNTQTCNTILLTLLQRHREAKSAASIDFVPGSYVETLLNLMEQSDASSSSTATPLSINDVFALCREFMAAGVTGTLVTVEWAMAHLIKDPLLQDKLYRHIHDVVGDRALEEEDLPHLPYLRALVAETMRLHPPGHFLMPFSVSETVQLGGYELRRDDRIYFNVSNMSTDSTIWDAPMEFRPERMLSTEMDMTGTKKKMGMIPFGAGRRICPGMGVGLMFTEMLVGRLVQDFHWFAPSSQEIDVVTEHLDLTLRMEKPLQAIIKPR